MMKDTETNLTWEMLDHLFEVDVIIGSIKWKNPPGNRRRFLIGRDAGCSTHKLGYVPIYINGKSYKRHRLIWFYAKKRWPSLDLDHVDGVKSNDSLFNLREVNHAQNLQNCGMRRHNKSGIKGVYWDKKRNKWCAKIKIDGKHFYLGRFSSLTEAAEARSLAEEKYHPFRRAA